MVNKTLKKLIDDYLADVEKFMNLMHNQIGDINPLRAVKENRIAREGYIGDNNQIHYSFHGRGCEVKTKERIIDFDFGSNFRHDVFDLWRLAIYAASRNKDFPEYANKRILERDFNKLIEEGAISKDAYEYEDLYYLNPSESEQK